MIDAHERTRRFDTATLITGSFCPVTKSNILHLANKSSCPIFSRFCLSLPGIFTPTTSITLPSTYPAVNPTERSEKRSLEDQVLEYLPTGSCQSCARHLTRNGQAWTLITITAPSPLKFKSRVIECSTQIRTDCLGLPGFARLENLLELVVSDGTKTASGSYLIEFLPQRFNCSRRDNTACNCYHEFLL